MKTKVPSAMSKISFHGTGSAQTTSRSLLLKLGWAWFVWKHKSMEAFLLLIVRPPRLSNQAVRPGCQLTWKSIPDRA